MMKRSLGQQNIFAIFRTFGRYITNPRGTFVENVKKSKINPPKSTVHTKSIKKTLLCRIAIRQHILVIPLRVRIEV
jgi:hypothetical protein